MFSRYANFDISRKIDRNIYVLDNEKDIDSSKDSELDAKRFFHLDQSVDHLKRDDLLRKCDIFLLYGISGWVRSTELENYIENLGIDKKRCAGFILVK